MGSAALRGFRTPAHNKRSTKELLFLSTQGSGHFSISAPNIFVWGIPREIKSKTESCCESSQQRYQSTFCTIACRHHAELQIRMLIWVQDGEQSRSEPWVLQRCGVFEHNKRSTKELLFLSSEDHQGLDLCPPQSLPVSVADPQSLAYAATILSPFAVTGHAVNCPAMSSDRTLMFVGIESYPPRSGSSSFLYRLPLSTGRTVFAPGV